MNHELRKFRIELRTDTFYEFFTNLILRYRVSVASLRSHGVIRICYGDNTRNLRNILALKAVGITSAVVSFVMVMSTDA